jgi:hypothetical protein
MKLRGAIRADDIKHNISHVVSFLLRKEKIKKQ